MKSKHLEDEVYKAVVGGEFEIDQEGRVWRIATRRGNRWNSTTTVTPCRRRRAEHTTGSGYLQVRVMVEGVRYNALAHRLVWLHTRGPIPGDLTINHRNGMKNDNRPENLELATHREQNLHALRVLRVGRALHQSGEENSMAKLTEEQVIEIRGRRAAGEKLADIAADFGVRYQAVSRIARRE